MSILGKIKIAILYLMLFTTTGCLDVVEEMTINADGSGVYRLTYDMSSLMEDGFTRSTFKKMVEEQSVFGPKPDESLEMDTLLYFRDMPVADRRKMQNAEFWNKVKMQVNISEKDQLVKMTLHLDFDELTDIDYFYDNLSNLEIQNGLSQNPFWPTSNSFELKKNKFSRLITLSAQNDLSGEELAFAKTFFADASYKCIYHLPGKVKKTTIPGATTDARTVVTTIPLLDLLNGTANLEGVIKFKKND